jgi:hypothetical protein
MAEHNEPREEFRRLRVWAAQNRFQSIQAQLSLAFTLCTLAKTEIEYCHIDQAQKLFEKVRHTARTVRRHLDEPGHVLPDQLDSCTNELMRLEARISNLAADIKVRESNVVNNLPSAEAVRVDENRDRPIKKQTRDPIDKSRNERQKTVLLMEVFGQTCARAARLLNKPSSEADNPHKNISRSKKRK